MTKLVIKRTDIIKDYRVVFCNTVNENKKQKMKTKIRNNPRRKGRVYND